jgi:hypothetical protein
MANNEQMNAMIEMLSQRLNAEPEQVKDALEKGKLDKVLMNMDQKQASKISAILSDPEQSKKVLSTPQAQALIKKLMG